MAYTDRLVSIEVICYNHEKYIEDALKSVLAQTYDNIEVIICDDFSTDRSWGIIQSFVPELQKRFHRVTVFQNPCNMGLTTSLNKLIEKAVGSVVFALSGDDMIAEKYVEEVMQACIEYPDASVFVTNGYQVEEKTGYADTASLSLTPWYEQAPDLCKDTLFERLYWKNCIFAPGVSIKREVFDKFGRYDTDIFIEDLEYWLRISRTKETEFIYIDKPLVFYRKNPDSVSSQVENEHYIERNLRLAAEHEKIIDKYGVYVGEDEYVRRKWAFLLNERAFYRMNMPKEEKKVLQNRLYPFIKKNWRILGWKELITYYRMYFCVLRNR